MKNKITCWDSPYYRIQPLVGACACFTCKVVSVFRFANLSLSSTTAPVAAVQHHYHISQPASPAASWVDSVVALRQLILLFLIGLAIPIPTSVGPRTKRRPAPEIKTTVFQSLSSSLQATWIPSISSRQGDDCHSFNVCLRKPTSSVKKRLLLL